MKAIIFTRHALTPAQRQGIELTSFDAIIEDPQAARTLRNRRDAVRIIAHWFTLAAGDPWLQVFGVIPPILRSTLFCAHSEGNGHIVQILEAHNINRALEGEKPVFEFGGWLNTGEYAIKPPSPCGHCAHASGQLDGESCRECGGAGFLF